MAQVRRPSCVVTPCPWVTPSMAIALPVSHLSSFSGLLSLFSWRVRQPLVCQLVSDVCLISHMSSSGVFIHPRGTSRVWRCLQARPTHRPMAPAPFMPQLLPALSTSCVGSFGISWLGREPECPQPSGWVCTTLQWLLYKGRFLHLLSEPVVVFWLSYLYKQCPFGYMGRKKPRNTEISGLIVLSILLCQSRYNIDLGFFFLGLVLTFRADQGQPPARL